MKIRHPCPSRAPSSKPGDFLPVLQLVEQPADAFQVGGCAFVDQIGLAAHDQHRALGMILAPVREPARDQLGGGGVDALRRRSAISARSRASASASVRPDSRALT